MSAIRYVLACSLAVAACSKAEPSKPTTSANRFEIKVTANGFEPADVKVPAGTPVTLVFERKTDETCAKEIVLEVDGKSIEKALPLNQPVEVALTFPKAGELTYSCKMGMVQGSITVQ